MSQPSSTDTRKRPGRRHLLIGAAAALPLAGLGLMGTGALRQAAQLRRTGDQARDPVPALPPPDRAMQVYHLGHSLLGAQIPHLLATFAGPGHGYHMQRGSGTSLRAHWSPEEPIIDFEVANIAPHWRDPHAAIGSGDYDAVILTEMVELGDALRYFDVARYLTLWANLARNAAQHTRLFLYETWHRLDDERGWLARIDEDLHDLWLGRLAGPDTAQNPQRPLYLIPGGQVLAALVRRAEAGRLMAFARREALFGRTEDGSTDPIHLSDLGAYVIALSHFAVLYHRAPLGLPHDPQLVSGQRLVGLTPESAREIQQIVWETVSSLPRTGLPPSGSQRAGPLLMRPERPTQKA